MTATLKDVRAAGHRYFWIHRGNRVPANRQWHLAQSVNDYKIRFCTDDRDSDAIYFDDCPARPLTPPEPLEGK